MKSKNQGEIEPLLTHHYTTSFAGDTTRRLADTFRRDGYVKLSELLPKIGKERLRIETTRIVEAAARRIDKEIRATGNTPRKMSTVGFDKILEIGSWIPDLYESNVLKDLLSNIAGVRVSTCGYEPERMTITKQEKVGDTHGWHWGDYSFAVIFIVEAPSIEAGGMLQCVPHTRWDKSDPQIHQILVENAIRSYYHSTGDIYFLKTDTTLHRTYPLVLDGVRIIINFTYEGPDDHDRLLSHETMEAIYA